MTEPRLARRARPLFAPRLARRARRLAAPADCAVPGGAPANWTLNCDSLAAGKEAVAEITVRSNPKRLTDPGAVLLAAGANDFNSSSPAGDSAFGFSTSNDGSSWTDHGPIANFTGLTQGNPRVYFHRSGTLYYSGVTSDRSDACDPSSGVVLLRNKDPQADADVWDDRLIAPNTVNAVRDKPALAVSRDNVFVSWTEFTFTGSSCATHRFVSAPIRIARVPHDDGNALGGATFLPSVPGSTQSQGSAIERDGNGGLWVAWEEFGTALGAEIRLAHWNEGSASWDLPGGFQTVGQAGTFSPMQGFLFRSNAFPQIAVLSDGPHVVWTNVVSKQVGSSTLGFTRVFHWDRATGTKTEIDPAVDGDVDDPSDVDDQIYPWIAPAGSSSNGPQNEYVVGYGETDEGGADAFDNQLNWYAYRSDTCRGPMWLLDRYGSTACYRGGCREAEAVGRGVEAPTASVPSAGGSTLQGCPIIMEVADGTTDPQDLHRAAEVRGRHAAGAWREAVDRACQGAWRRSHDDLSLARPDAGRRDRRALRPASGARCGGRGAHSRARACAGAQDAGGRGLGGSVAAVGLRERARIGRVLTAERPAWPKALIARLLGISRQSLYHPPAVEPVEPVEPVPVAGGVVVRGPWPDRRPALSDDLVIEAHILDVCRERPRFGTRRVTAMVRRRLGGSGAARGVVNRKRVQRVMAEHGLLVPQRRIPRGEHNGRIETTRSDEVWATDLSKIATREGWLWIVGVIDCHDRDLIGRRYGISADTTMCLGALHDAVWERFPDSLDKLKAAGPQLSHDWGSQFTSRRYQAELSTLGIRSRPTMIGSPEQNGIMERFFGSLKHEEVWTTEYDTRVQAIEALDAWIDDYRTERPHQALGYLTPAEYRATTAQTGSTCATQAA